MHIVYQFLLYIRCRSNQKKHKKQKTSNRFIGPTHKVTSASLTYCATYKSESESHSVLSDSLRPHGLYSPWNSPGQNTGVGNLSLLQGIFPTQESNGGLLHCRQILYQLSNQGCHLDYIAPKPEARVVQESFNLVSRP